MPRLKNLDYSLRHDDVTAQKAKKVVQAAQLSHDINGYNDESKFWPSQNLKLKIMKAIVCINAELNLVS